MYEMLFTVVAVMLNQADEQLMRAALKALEEVLPYAEAFDPFEYGRFGEPTQDVDIEHAHAITAKLKERLLEE